MARAAAAAAARTIVGLGRFALRSRLSSRAEEKDFPPSLARPNYLGRRAGCSPVSEAKKLSHCRAATIIVSNQVDLRLAESGATGAEREWASSKVRLARERRESVKRRGSVAARAE